MFKTYKFRMYPNNNQSILINKTFGCVRFVYNYFLNKCRINNYLKSTDMCNELNQLYIEYPFLNEVDSCSLRCAIFNLEDSFKNYIAKRCNYPYFKNKFSKQSFKINAFRSSYKGNNHCNIEIYKDINKIKLPKIGLVSIKGYRNLNKIDGKIINATIEKETTGKYYVSVVVEIKDKEVTKKEPANIVGIDLGIKDLAVLSDGTKYSNPKELSKRLKQIKRLQRKLARQVNHSKNYNKTKVKLARLHSKIKNGRKHNIIKIVNEIVKNYDCIVSENLNVQGMNKNHIIAKSIMDASFYKICEMIKWKTKIQRKYYYQVDTYYPSSKICNHCGYKTEITTDLNVRNWECPICGNLNDRDINASLNIMFEGLKIHYLKTING